MTKGESEEEQRLQGNQESLYPAAREGLDGVKGLCTVGVTILMALLLHYDNCQDKIAT